jgi:hypothetical protein
VKGNLYVVGQHTSNIVIISADGQYQKQILTNEDGLNSPSPANATTYEYLGVAVLGIVDILKSSEQDSTCKFLFTTQHINESS